MPRPVTVSVRVPLPPAEVYDYLDAIVHLPDFNDHLMSEWRFSGPARGVGARATAKAHFGALRDTMDIEVIEAEWPRRIVGRNSLRKVGRVGQATFRLGPLLDGGTHIDFEYVWVKTPPLERLLGPLARFAVHKAHESAMRRLADQLSGRPSRAEEIIRATDSLAASSS